MKNKKNQFSEIRKAFYDGPIDTMRWERHKKQEERRKKRKELRKKIRSLLQKSLHKTHKNRNN